MASEIQVANSALIRLGEKRIIALDASSETSRTLVDQLPISRDALTRAFRWNFAMKRASLAASPDAPEWGFDFQYEVPIDFLALDQVNDVYVGLDMSDYRNSDLAEYSLEGRMILTNEGAPLKVRYIRQVVDAGSWDALFADALALKIAVDCCEKITQSTAKRESVKGDLKDAIRAAVRVNAIEKPPAPVPDDSWIIARLG